MGGLYRRALYFHHHRPHLRLVRPGDSAPVPGKSLDFEGPAESEAGSEQEEKILAELNRAVSDSRMRIDEETFRFQPTKKSAFLPLAVNLGAILTVAAAVFSFLYFFDRDRADIVTPRSGITSAEGQLLEAVRSESEAALAAKDREITDIRNQLAGINEEWEAIQSEAQERLAAQEAALRAQLAEELEAERRRLAAEGVAARDIDAALAELQAARETEISEEVAAIEAELAQQLAEQEESFRALHQEYESSLVSAREERQAIESETQARIARLNQESAQREGQLEEERQGALQELEALQSRQERENLVLDQLIGRYRGINELVAGGEYDAASEELEELQTYLEDPAVIELPAIQRRLSTETFIISTIEEVIDQRRSRATTPSLADAGRIERVAARVEEANSLLEAGDLEAANQLYREAISEIPDVATAFRRLEEAEELADTERIAAVEEALSQGYTLLATQDYEPSLQEFRNALALLAAGAADSQALTEGILEAGSQLLRQENRSLQEDLEAARLALVERPETPAPEVPPREAPSADAGGTQVAESNPSGPSGPSLLLERLDIIEERLAAGAATLNGPRDDLAALLQAKVVTRRVLNTEPTLSRHPGLGSRLDSYFDALVSESEAEGRRNALMDLAEALNVETAAPGPRSGAQELEVLSEASLWRDIFAAIEKLATTFPESSS